MLKIKLLLVFCLSALLSGCFTPMSVARINKEWGEKGEYYAYVIATGNVAKEISQNNELDGCADGPLVHDNVVFLTLYCVDKKAGFATVCPTKGVHQFVANWILQRLKYLDVGDIRLRTDQDASVQAWAEQVRVGCSQRSVCEAAPMCSSEPRRRSTLSSTTT